MCDCHEKFSLDNHIVATITDGESVMMKFGKATSSINITCLAPAVHLHICDILYKKNMIIDGLENSYDEEDKDENDDSGRSNDFEAQDCDQEAPILVPYLAKVATKVSQNCRIVLQITSS